jgi:molybdopterin synthase sulfur carrier subunit
MITVTCRFYATLRDLVGEGTMDFSLNQEATVLDLVKEINKRSKKSFLKEILNERGEVKPYYKVILNGRDIDFLNKLNTKLKDKDLILFFPPVGGG